MVTQNMLRKHERKYVASEKNNSICDTFRSNQMPLTDQIIVRAHLFLNYNLIQVRWVKNVSYFLSSYHFSYIKISSMLSIHTIYALFKIASWMNVYNSPKLIQRFIYSLALVALQWEEKLKWKI